MNDIYLLDTDIVIYWLKNKFPKINQRIKETSDDCIFISSITVAELYFGAYNSSKKQENIRLIDELLNEKHFKRIERLKIGFIERPLLEVL